MPLYQTLSSLLLTFFITVSYSQANTPTGHPTAAPTECVCQSWTGNSNYLLDSGKGCKSSFDGHAICESYCSDKHECQCVSAKDDKLCELEINITSAISAASSAFATWVIILIVAGSVCGFCLIGCIIYCVCAGAFCCATAGKNKNTSGGVV